MIVTENSLTILQRKRTFATKEQRKNNDNERYLKKH